MTSLNIGPADHDHDHDQDHDHDHDHEHHDAEFANNDQSVLTRRKRNVYDLGNTTWDQVNKQTQTNNQNLFSVLAQDIVL